MSWACAYEKPAPRELAAYVSIPVPRHSDLPWPTVCPGYSTALPEAIEIARAWMHWDKGQLAAFTRGEPTDALLHGVELFAGWVESLKSKLMAEQSKGRG